MTGPAGPARAVRTGRLGAVDVPGSGEVMTELVRSGGVVIEEITSSSSVDPVTYDQEQDEWVMVLQGSAELEVEGQPVHLEAGDWIWLPAHTLHRVARTEAGTRWVAVHVHPA